MPDIQAFRGIRYDLGHVGSLSDVIAPPYDVIDPAFQDELYKKHPANAIRLILNRDEPGDDEQNNRYTRAARFLKNWQREGLLQREAQPAIYVYHQSFEYDGQTFNRRGFMSRVRLENFGEGTIYPHEETHAGAKADRLKLWNHCDANLSQIFGIYPDETNEAQELLEQAIENVAPIEATDHLGVVHRLWPVTNLDVITKVTAAMAARPTFIADGHHRYETACNYRDGKSEQQALPPDHPANFVLMMCVSMNDPGMIVLPTHRLLHGIEELDSDQLAERLGDCFTTKVIGEGADLAHSLWQVIEDQDDQRTIGLYTAKDSRWTQSTLSDVGWQKLSEIAPDRSDDWRGLGVSVLHELIIKHCLKFDKHPKPQYVHQVDEVVCGLNDGGENGETFALAALVMPATLDHIRAISHHGERMPAKSTYFYPKLLSGLVFNPLK